MTNPSPYYKPNIPTGFKTLLKWIAYEPILLEQYLTTLDNKAYQQLFWNTYWRLVLIMIGLFLFGNYCFVWFDLPTLFIEQYPQEFQYKWQQLQSNGTKYIYLLKHNVVGLIAGLVFGLLFGLFVSFSGGVAIGIAVSLAAGLIGGFTIGIAIGYAVAVARGISLSWKQGLQEGLFIGVGVGLAFGLIHGLSVGFIYGLATSVSFWVFYFRINELPRHYIQSLFVKKFETTPYIKMATIWLPIFPLEKKLKELAKSQITETEEFITFLVAHRPLQYTLAMHLQHIIKAQRLYDTPIILMHFRPDTTAFQMPLLLPDLSEFQPSDKWLSAHFNIKNVLVKAQRTANLYDRLENYKAAVQQINTFKQIHLEEKTIWQSYYLEVFEKWEQEAEGELKRLEEVISLQ